MVLGVMGVISNVKAVSEEKFTPVVSAVLAESSEVLSTQNSRSMDHVPSDEVEFVHSDHFSDALLLRGQIFDNSSVVVVMAW
jgi:hypothetical protein